MGKGGKTTVGYWYKVAYHAGLGVGPIDALLEFRGGDQTAWAGNLTSSGTITISAPNLWGGEKDQGGISGDVDVMFGEATQQPNAYLSSVFGSQQPAWRGLATLVFKGGRYGAMNPYPQKPSYKIMRVVKGWDNDVCWYPEKAAIGLANDPLIQAIIAGITWEKTVGSPITFTSPGDVASWATDPSAYATEPSTLTPTFPAGIGATGLLWMHIDAPNGVPNSFTMDVKINYDDSGKVIGTSGVTIGDSTPPLPVDTYLTATGVQVIVPASSAPFHGWVCFACVDSLDINTGLALGTPTQHRMIVASSAVMESWYSMNPAHVLYYARTQQDMGREPVGNMSDASFRAAADWYASQAFGLCTAYDPASETYDDFVARIEKVAGCSMSRSPIDGLWYLDIANGVYDLESLPVLTDDDILDFSESPSVQDSATNSVSVTFFDPQEKESLTTAPVQAMALIDAFGTIFDQASYPELPTYDLALRVATRDLRASVTPTRAFELTTTRAPYGWRVGTYFRLQSPKRGIADMVCILAEKSSGTLKSGAIKITASQDIYSLPAATFIDAEHGVDTRPSQKPVAIALQRLFEAPYIEVVTSLSRANLAVLPDDVGFGFAVAADPASSRDFTETVSAAGGDFAAVGTGEWCPTATMAQASAFGDTTFTLSQGVNLELVAVGMAGLWDDEIVRVDAIDVGTGAVQFGRGCADTTPAVHAAGSRVWFFGAVAANDFTEYTAGETISVKLLTNTGTQQLDPTMATALSLTFSQRQFRPYPPAQVTLNGASPWGNPAITGSLQLSWVHRNRLIQADQLVDTSMAGVAPEAGTTYTVRVYDSSNTLVATLAGIDATALRWTPATVGSYRVELESARDGLASWQRHSFSFSISALDHSFYIAESGSNHYATEDGSGAYLME
jgi:hypothetical protein